MIYHCTKALAAKLPEVSSEALRAATPIEGWHAHLYLIDRRQCVMFCHDTTRFTVFCAGLRKEQFKGLAQLHKESFRTALISLGVGESAIKRAELAMGKGFFDTATDRSVLGALRQARSDMDGYLSDYGNIMDVDPVALVRWLNDRPVSARGVWLWPEKDMLELVGGL